MDRIDHVLAGNHKQIAALSPTLTVRLTSPTTKVIAFPITSGATAMAKACLFDIVPEGSGLDGRSLLSISISK